VSASEKLRALGLALQTDTPLNYGRVDSLNTLGDALPQIVAVVEDSENAIEQALLFVERHIQEDHAKPLRAVLKNALATLAALEKELP